MDIRSLPVALSERVEAKLISDLSGIHCVGKILFVSKNKQNSITQLILENQQIMILNVISPLSTIVPFHDSHVTRKLYLESGTRSSQNIEKAANSKHVT